MANGEKMRCSICGAASVAEYRPFCSRRCADVDLSRWLKGAYVIAGSGSADADEDGDDSLAQGAADQKRAEPDSPEN